MKLRISPSIKLILNLFTIIMQQSKHSNQPDHKSSKGTKDRSGESPSPLKVKENQNQFEESKHMAKDFEFHLSISVSILSLCAVATDQLSHSGGGLPNYIILGMFPRGLVICIHCEILNTFVHQILINQYSSSSYGDDS